MHAVNIAIINFQNSKKEKTFLYPLRQQNSLEHKY